MFISSSSVEPHKSQESEIIIFGVYILKEGNENLHHHKTLAGTSRCELIFFPVFFTLVYDAVAARSRNALPAKSSQQLQQPWEDKLTCVVVPKIHDP